MAPRPRPYDKFMVAYKIGADLQLRAVRPEHRWVWVAGVLALAAQSPIRGHLVGVNAEPITTKDIAEEASVTTSMARKALAGLRDLDLIQVDAELGVEWVPNFKIYNPDPPASSKESERFRKRAQRARERLTRRLAKVA
jgi:hypothetical protein